jgi:glutathione S-transferase
MRLYDFPQTPNPRRVHVFVAVKGLDLPIEQVDVLAGANRTPEFLAKNPFGGLLPVLELDDGSA